MFHNDRWGVFIICVCDSDKTNSKKASYETTFCYVMSWSWSCYVMAITLDINTLFLCSVLLPADSWGLYFAHLSLCSLTLIITRLLLLMTVSGLFSVNQDMYMDSSNYKLVDWQFPTMQTLVSLTADLHRLAVKALILWTHLSLNSFATVSQTDIGFSALGLNQNHNFDPMSSDETPMRLCHLVVKIFAKNHSAKILIIVFIL